MMHSIERLLLAFSVIGTAACAAAGAGGAGAAAHSGADSTVVYVVRHAEKAVVANDPNPPLSEAGQARARALAAELRDAGVDAVLVTQLQRTQATAAPLASALRIVPDTFQTRAEGHVAAVAAAARAHTGRTVLVVGHSNTVPAIVTALGGPAMAELCDAEYANLFVVVLKPGQPARVHRRSYGQADPPGAGNCTR